ncbi:hypothetical protein [Nocardioides sp.]|uniref:hypothetical protein n=1 Tax=Nocardioides sp. TaxID=35761 RepID=UPI0035B084B0
MTFTQRDAQALTYLATRLREDTPGCGKWDQNGTYAVLAELRGQSLSEVVHRVVGHALDPEARTPGSIRRPFIPKRDTEPARRQPAKAGEDCKRHPGEYVGSCRACAVEVLPSQWGDVELVDDDRSAGRALLAEIRARRQAPLGLTKYGEALIASATPETAGPGRETSPQPGPVDRPETACLAPGCFRPTRDGICDRCRADAIALDEQAANQALIERLQANERARAHTRPEPSPEPPRRFTSADINHDRVRAAMTRAAEQRSTT